MDSKKISEYTAVAIIIIALLIFAWEFTTRDVRFCRSALAALVKGSITASKFIDWEQLDATGFDVGSIYRRLANDQEKENYRNTFIQNFALGFNYAKGDFGKFSNWRVLERKGTKVVVGATYLVYNKTILFRLSKSPKTKIIAIEWMQ